MGSLRKGHLVVDKEAERFWDKLVDSWLEETGILYEYSKAHEINIVTLCLSLFLVATQGQGISKETYSYISGGWEATGICEGESHGKTAGTLTWNSLLK
jgi:hypothetical protein